MACTCVCVCMCLYIYPTEKNRSLLFRAYKKQGEGAGLPASVIKRWCRKRGVEKSFDTIRRVCSVILFSTRISRSSTFFSLLNSRKKEELRWRHFVFEKIYIRVWPQSCVCTDTTDNCNLCVSFPSRFFNLFFYFYFFYRYQLLAKTFWSLVLCETGCARKNFKKYPFWFLR